MKNIRSIQNFKKKRNTDPNLGSTKVDTTRFEQTNELVPILALTKLRQDICQKFIQFKLRTDLSHEQIGLLISSDKGKVSKILKSQIDEFSTDRLITYLQRLMPKTRLKIL